MIPDTTFNQGLSSKGNVQSDSTLENKLERFLVSYVRRFADMNDLGYETRNV